MGTTGFPAAIQRWLSELHLATEEFQPVFRIEENKNNLLLDLLIQDRARTQVLTSVRGSEAEVTLRNVWDGEWKEKAGDAYLSVLNY